MSYNNSGRSRFASPQRSRFAQRNNVRSSINPQRYINAAIAPTQEAPYESKHTFADFGLLPQIVDNITARGYTNPTPIQDQGIPVLLQNQDIVGIANTGTGKTAAFLLPLIHKITNDPTQGALIMAPTRELALQIVDEFRYFAKQLPLSVCLCIGGASMDRQISQLRENPHFVIGTPGRIKDLVDRGIINTSMFTNIVLDEVDRMLDIGFRKDIMYLISKLPEDRLCAFFSATMTNDVAVIMHSFLRNPVHVSVKTQETNQHIQQDIVRINPGSNKVDVLHGLLIQEQFERVIVFGRTKHGINKLEQKLSERGVRVRAIHGNKSQEARRRSLEDFKRGKVQALLATDIAARGIDVEGVTHVINFDEPQSYEDYVHRIGRTGRAGKMGIALTFVG